MDALSPGGDSDAQRALGSTGTADEEVEILNASGELREGWISVKEEWLEERNGRKRETSLLEETSGGGGIECSVSPVLDCFSLIALH